MKDTILTAILTALIVLSGTAIAVKVVRAENQPATFAQAVGYGQGQGYGQPGNGGCSRGCATGTRRGGCAGGPGGCQGTGAQADPGLIDTIKGAVSDYYVQTTGDADFTVDVQDFGCHQEAYVIKDGARVMGFSVSGNSITPIQQ